MYSTCIHVYDTVHTSILNSSSSVFLTAPSRVKGRDITNVAMETEVLRAYCTLSNGKSAAESANTCRVLHIDVCVSLLYDFAVRTHSSVCQHYHSTSIISQS